MVMAMDVCKRNVSSTYTFTYLLFPLLSLLSVTVLIKKHKLLTVLHHLPLLLRKKLYKTLQLTAQDNYISQYKQSRTSFLLDITDQNYTKKNTLIIYHLYITHIIYLSRKTRSIKTMLTIISVQAGFRPYRVMSGAKFNATENFRRNRKLSLRNFVTISQ